MGKLLKILGVIFIVAVIIIGVLFGYMAIQGSRLDRESKAYVDRVTPIILEDLNKETLLRYVYPGFTDAITPEEIDKIFTWFESLGRFKEYKESTGEVNISVTNKGKTIVGNYTANVDFETGPASVKIQVIKENGDWYITNFRIYSSALME